MNAANNVSTEWIIQALTTGRFAEKLEAQRSLDDPSLTLDRGAIRNELLRLIKEDYNPKRENLGNPGDISGVRCWLLGSVGRLQSEQGEPEKTLRLHVDHKYETDPWSRYWALESLIRRNPDDLKKICEPVAKSDPDPLPQMLANAVMARAGEQSLELELRKILSGPARDKDEARLQWCVLRALRFIYLPSTVDFICAFVANARYDDNTYDAIAALGNVPSHCSGAENAGLVLSAFITRHRRFQFWDSMRIRAIESLGNLKIESTAPLLLEELTDLNPAVAKGAAQALEAILGPAIVVSRVLEQLAKRGDRELLRFARGLREMSNQKAIVDELGAAMLSHSGPSQEYSQRLLSEIGGASAFEKLRSMTKSTERYLTILDNADERLQKMFEDTIGEARTGFKVVIGMDVIVFVIGIMLLGLSAYLSLHEDKPFTSWSTWITGSTGLLATIYGKFFAQPRAQVEKSVQYLSGLKAVFLGYLRQLRQSDQAYTRRVLEDKPLTATETKDFNEVIEQIMEKAVKHLTDKPK